VTAPGHAGSLGVAEADAGGGELGRLAERQRQVEALLAISSTVVSTLDPTEALRRICAELARLFRADTVSAHLLDPSSDTLLPTAAYHVPKAYLAVLGAMGLPLREQGFHLALWRDRRPVWTDDVAADPRFGHEVFRQFPHQSGLMIPLVIDDEVAGGFYAVWWHERRRLTAEDVILAEQVAAQVGFFLRNTRLFRQTERDRQRLEALQDVSRRLLGAHDTDQILTLITEESRRLLGADAAGLRLVEGDELVLRARTEGPAAAAVMARPRLKVGESLSGIVVCSGAPLVIEDVVDDARLDPGHRRGAASVGLHGFLGVPLRARGDVTGVLNLYTRSRRRFLPDEVALLSALADQASLALDKGALLEEAERGRQLVERLYTVGIAMQRSWERADRLGAFVRGAHEIVGFDRVNVFLVTPDGAELELATTEDGRAPALRLPLAPGAGPFFDAAHGRRPVVVLDDGTLAAARPLDADFQGHPHLRTRRFVVVPLVVGERVIGVASADNKPSRRPIAASHVEPFSLLCQQLATALEEARHYAESRAREQEATLLYRLTREVTSSLEPDRVLDLVTATTVEALRGDACAIFVPDPARTGLVYLRGRRFDPRLMDSLVLRPGEGVVGRAFEERRPFWTRDCLADTAREYGPATLAFLDEPGRPRAILAAPMISRGQVHGVLAVHGFRPRDFTADEMRLLSALADHAAIAMENARLFEEAQTQKSRLTSIFDSTSDGMMLVDRHGEVVAANRRAGELLGAGPAAVAGSRLVDLLTAQVPDADELARAAGPLFALLAAPEPGGEGDLELRTTGQILHWVGRATRAGADGPGLTLTFHDVTHEREVSRMKSDFVSFVTHQLRTPLAGIRWMLELSAQGTGLPADTAGYIQDAREAAERLIGLVNDLLDIARLESGKLAVEPAEVDVASLTRDVLAELDPLVRERGHALALHAGAGATALADVQLLRQVVLNLVGNAVKYTPAGGRIDVRIEAVPGHLRWQVTDTGIGIPREAQRRLFEKFFRADNAVTVETEGTGLGLYLIKLIVERLRGRVWCESEEGQGSTFGFEVPR
jgi:PAS domain S-box-containing protein